MIWTTPCTSLSEFKQLSAIFFLLHNEKVHICSQMLHNILFVWKPQVCLLFTTDDNLETSAVAYVKLQY